MVLTLEDIGKVFKLKPKRYFWCIDIQESIQFKDEPTYVVFNQMASSIPVYFGNIVESNLYGALKKCEIEFGSLDIDEEEIYDNVREFNKAKSFIYNFECVETNRQYNMIDLGIPSGLLWADRNIGAASPEESGLYFQWGDTQGYTAEQVGDGEGLKPFRLSDYKFSIDGSASNFSKYNDADSKTVLDPEDDAAHVLMGGNWRMPTFEECKELCLNTDIYLVPSEGEEIQGTAQEQNGYIRINWASQAEGTLKGVKFYKKGDKQTYMFVPMSGNANNGSVRNVGEGGYLWTSSLFSSGVLLAWIFGFSAGVGVVGGDFRYFGIPVRGVCK